MRRAEIPIESGAEVEAFLRAHESGSTALAVLERADHSLALLKIEAGYATLLSFLSASESGPSRVQETFIGTVYDATITQVHAIKNVGDTSVRQPERAEIAGSRLAGTINLTYYSQDEQAELMEALRGIVARSS